MTFPEDHVFAGLERHAYRCVVIDPPWRFVAGVKGRPQHYPRMTDKDIAALPMKELLHPEGAWVFVWVTSPKAHHAFEIVGRGRYSARGQKVLDGWGLRYSGRAFVWVKSAKRDGKVIRPFWIDPDHMHFGQGFTTRKSCEDCLLFRTGNPARLRRDIRELIVAPVREHSRKPEEAYDRIEAFCPGPRADLFSRQSRAGWAEFGNESGKFNIGVAA